MDGTTPVSFRLGIRGRTLDASYEVPADLVPVDAILPVLQQFTNQVVAQAVETDGKPVSCRAGCGACCRQLVPIAEPEARMLAHAVAKMPEPRRTAVRDRFRAAAEKLAEFRDPASRSGTLREFGLAYFAKRVACPFLEEESCGIHPSRPLACREYLVTSPADNCSTPSPDAIQMVDLGARPSHALPRVETGRPAWLPLVFALDWAERHAHEAQALKTGPEWMKTFVETLA